MQRAARLAAAVPGDQHPGAERADAADIGHDQSRPAGIQDDRLGLEAALIAQRPVGIDLAEDGEVADPQLSTEITHDILAAEDPAALEPVLLQIVGEALL